jgi:hypothetical protein
MARQRARRVVSVTNSDGRNHGRRDGRVAATLNVQGNSDDDSDDDSREEVQREREEIEEEEEEEEEEDDERDEDDEKIDYKSMTKNDIIEMCQGLRKKIKQSDKAKENERKNVNKVMMSLQKERETNDRLQKRLDDVDENSGLTTTSTTEVATLSIEFTESQRRFLGSAIRTIVFKKHKVTTARSFESGEIQLMLHRHLGEGYCTEDMMAAYRNSLVKLVNHELTQRRNHVNCKVLEKWSGKYDVNLLCCCCAIVIVLTFILLIALQSQSALEVTCRMPIFS